jgi:hypothetical protein
MQQSSSNLFFEHLLPSFKVENVIWLSHDILRATDDECWKESGTHSGATPRMPRSSCALKKPKAPHATSLSNASEKKT